MRFLERSAEQQRAERELAEQARQAQEDAERQRREEREKWVQAQLRAGRRFRLLALGMGVLAVAALVLLFAAVDSTRRADAERGRAEVERSNAEAQAALDELLAKVAAYGPDIRVTVEGHTDSTGSDSDNKLLSEQRAKSVWQYLAPGLKLAAEQVNIKGYGESRPVASNDDEEGRALNRRVDLLIKPGSRLKP